VTEYARPQFYAGLLVEDRAFLGGVEPEGTSRHWTCRQSMVGGGPSG
jgi:hypothetical protein